MEIPNTVYFLDNANEWQPGELINEVAPGVYDVQIVDGNEQKSRCLISLSSIVHRDGKLPQEGIANLSSLTYVNEPSILDNLYVRFNNGNPYTLGGHTCISINPYQQLGLYSNDMKSAYLNPSKREILPPHIYSISAIALNTIQQRLANNQSIVLSGESGSGKTEAAKIVLDHIAYATCEKSKPSLINKVLLSAPLLESFGNARTEKNNNSSRFGSQIKVTIDDNMCLVGCHRDASLLEKNRVVSQSNPGERNFHIFYQLFSAPSSVKMRWNLLGKNSADFKYTQVSDKQISFAQDEIDGERFISTTAALQQLGINSATSDHMFRLLSGILHLGQIVFVASGDRSTTNMEASDFKAACTLLGLNPETLTSMLTRRGIEVGKVKDVRNGRRSVEETVVYLSPQQSADYRDALAKDLYNRLFLWLVDRLNQSTEPIQTESDTKDVRTISLLDIFGFENMKSNHFEQLCINYCNEKLQQWIRNDVLHSSQIECLEEGLACWEDPMTSDCSERIRMFEAKAGEKLGFFTLLNEECKLPKGSDSNFLSRLLNTWRNVPNSCASRDRLDRSNTFRIQHYAGQVLYEVDNFVEYNRDHVSLEILRMMPLGDNPLLIELYPTSINDENTPSNKQLSNTLPPSIARMHRNRKVPSFIRAQNATAKLIEQLDRLMNDLLHSKVYYIRCFKPNETKSSTEFDKQLILQQLRSSGLLEGMHTVQALYPFVKSHGEFVAQFGNLLPLLYVSVAEYETMNDFQRCQLYLTLLPDFDDSSKLLASPYNSHNGVRKRVYEMGKSKVYFSSDHTEAVNKLKELLRIQKGIVTFQAIVRGFIARRQYECTTDSIKVLTHERRHQAAIVLQSWFRMNQCVQLLRTLQLIQLESETTQIQVNQENDNGVSEFGRSHALPSHNYRQRSTYTRTRQTGKCSPGCNCSVQ